MGSRFRLPAPRPRWWIAAAAGAAALCTAEAALAADPAVCDLKTSARIVAVGDVHGAHDRFVTILRAAGLIDRRDRWSGRDTILVQTGDVLDRGPDSRKTMDLLRRLESEAPRAGGRVVSLLGNHEVMVMVGDFRYVSRGEYEAFRTRDSENVRERYYRAVLDDVRSRAEATGQELDEASLRKRFLDQTPLGLVEMVAAFGPAGEYGSWLRQHDTMARINGIVFVHGGISPDVAALGCESINETVRTELVAASPPTPEQATKQLSTSENGPLWFRGLALEEEAAYLERLETTLSALDARAIVVGHTVPSDSRVRARFGGRVFQIDTGMLDEEFFPGGRVSALEIQGDKVSVIYETEREDLGVTIQPALDPDAIPATAR